jgi:hypothetical protein
MRTRVLLLACVGGAALVVIGSSLALLRSGPAARSGSPTATHKTLYVSTAGADSGSCTAADPCASLTRAYQAAAPGDTIQIATGEYPDQSITGSSGSPAKVMRPAPGAQVSISSVEAHASWFELRGVTITGGVAAWSDSNHATFRNDHIGSRIYIAGARNFSLIGGDVGPYIDGPSWITHDNGVPPQNVLIQGVHFHDFTVSDPSIHSECMLVIAGNGITFDGDTWTNCAVFDLSFGYCCSSPASPTNVTVENNFFGRALSGAGTPVEFNSNLEPANYSLLYNSADGPFVLDQGQSTFSNVRVVGNVMPGTGCGRARWSYNVVTGIRCAGVRNKLVRNLGFVDPAAGDFHLTRTSPARHAGARTGYPLRDIDGHKRPHGRRVDAGAAQFVSH